MCVCVCVCGEGSQYTHMDHCMKTSVRNEVLATGVSGSKDQMFGTVQQVENLIPA